MKNIFLLFVIFYLNISITHALTIEEALTNQVAVEKNTGRSESYEIGFSGWVGSLKFDLNNKLITIAEITNLENNIHVINGVYKITKHEKFKNSIEFECEDVYLSILWRGKVWLMDDSLSPKIEMQQFHSPRKWQNLGKHGRNFLKTNKL